ncbi:cyclophane-forming radical SAM peptide maturase AmcB [Kitasatospora sp. NPDC052896]|uniref:cyclophane-forming radical SAM peptide maturase AmcB n=1 Tax=Kitasatospora sp. NPDC052896 TaxID=3364061 RepID=UPI0037CB9CE2
MSTLTLKRYDRRIARIPESIVMQMIGFCNLACRYCYLPDKDDKRPMSAEVAKAVADSIWKMEPLLGAGPITLIWHAGEPLAMGVERFTAILDIFEELRLRGLVRHSLQTNATLINDAWVDLFEAREMQVGVSIDGPADLNQDRVDRRGRPAFDRIMRGIERLRARDFPFTVIAVVTASAPARATELLDFIAGLGPQLIALSIEEKEGANTTDVAISPDQARVFWQDVLAWVRAAGSAGVPVRETDRLGKFLAYNPEERRGMLSKFRINPIPTVAINGDVVLLSPELAGISSETYGDFLAGNILKKDIPSILGSAHELRYVQEYLESLDNCESRCAFYSYCLGAQASPRYFEHGSFVPSETQCCRVSEQALVKALATTITKEKTA